MNEKDIRILNLVKQSILDGKNQIQSLNFYVPEDKQHLIKPFLEKIERLIMHSGFLIIPNEVSDTIAETMSKAAINHLKDTYRDCFKQIPKKAR